jgi:hypothetical protein
MAAPKGVTASVSAFRQGFLQTPKKNHAPDAPSHSTKLAVHQLAPPHDLAITTAISPRSK